MFAIIHPRQFRKKIPLVRRLFEASFRERLHWHASCGSVSEFTPDRRGRPWTAWRYAKFILTISGVYIGLVVLFVGATVMAMRP